MYWPKAGLLIPGTCCFASPRADAVQRLPVTCSCCAEKALPGLNSGMCCWRKKHHYKSHRFKSCVCHSPSPRCLGVARDCLTEQDTNPSEEKDAGDSQKAFLGFGTECMLQSTLPPWNLELLTAPCSQKGHSQSCLSDRKNNPAPKSG